LEKKKEKHWSECVTKRIFEIGQYLVKIWKKVSWSFFTAHGILDFTEKRFSTVLKALPKYSHCTATTAFTIFYSVFHNCDSFTTYDAIYMCFDWLIDYAVKWNVTYQVLSTTRHQSTESAVDSDWASTDLDIGKAALTVNVKTSRTLIMSAVNVLLYLAKVNRLPDQLVILWTAADTSTDT